MKNNILVIGFGHHAKRIYYRILEEARSENDFLVVELVERRTDVQNFFQNEKYLPLEISYVNQAIQNGELNRKIEKQLDMLTEKYHVSGVIISTDPAHHVGYAKWALSRNLPILMDKPISVHDNLSTTPSVAQKLSDDYRLLNKIYSRKKESFFSIVSQRRFHPAFAKAKELIMEVYKKTGCPITSIQIMHSDGQWRFPNEIIDIPYHSFNNGFGKCSHSGYHFFDILCYLIDTTNNGDKKINNVEIFANFLRPTDYVKQITLEDYRKLFKNFNSYNKYTAAEFNRIVKMYGEIDAFINFSFKHGAHTIALGSLNLIHNGFSQRGTLRPREDLYKGNGRVRHESYIIEQGPFQSLHIDSLQSREVNAAVPPSFGYGDEYHFDIHIFRNSSLFSEWDAYSKISLNEFAVQFIKGKSRGHQEDARRFATREFMEYIRVGNGRSISDFKTHENTVELIAGTYRSAALKFNKKNPLVTVKYN